MLDADAPSGLKLRKWFLILLGVANAIRFIFTGIEEVLILRLSISSSTLWILRCIPSIFFLLTASFVTHYLGCLYYSLQGSEGSQFRSIWFVFIFVFALTEFVCVSIFSAVSLKAFLHLLQFAFLILAIHGATILAIIWYFVVSVWRSLASNQSNSQTHKVLVRMLLLVTTVTISLLTMTLLRADEYEMIAGAQEWQTKAAGHFILLLIGESLSGLVMILVMTNALTGWETQVRASRFINTSNIATSSTTASSFVQLTSKSVGATSTSVNSNSGINGNNAMLSSSSNNASRIISTEASRILPSLSTSTARNTNSHNSAVSYHSISQQEQ
jgi:hypothetical protein